VSLPRSRRRRRRWLLRGLLVFAVPLIAAVALAIEVELAIHGTNLANDGRFLLDRVVGGGSGPVLRVTWLGDSTAAGVGASRPATALPRVVADALAAALGRPVELTVLAVTGARVDDVLHRQVGRVPAATDLVVVDVGSNDVTHLTPVADFRRRYRTLLDQLPHRAKVVLLGVPDMGAVTRFAQPLRAIAGWRGRTVDREVVHLARDRRLGYVDIAGKTGPSFRRHPGRYLAVDHYHPSDDGYRLWADAVVPVTEEVVRAGP